MEASTDYSWKNEIATAGYNGIFLLLYFRIFLKDLKKYTTFVDKILHNFKKISIKKDIKIKLGYKLNQLGYFAYYLLFIFLSNFRINSLKISYSQ